MKAKILVVDDDQQVLYLLGEVLTREGAEPHCVQSSPQAAERVERERFDGAFLDWSMPELSGLKLARRIRNSSVNAHCPIVMLTGFATPELREESLRTGINFFLPKPVSMQQVRVLLNGIRGLMLEERRTAPRIPVRTPVVCAWDQHQVKGRSLNLSATGMLAALEEAPPLQGWVNVGFSLPRDPQPYELTANVARVTVFAGSGQAVPNHQVGLHFVGVVPETLHRLTEFVERSQATLTA